MLLLPAQWQDAVYSGAAKDFPAFQWAVGATNSVGILTPVTGAAQPQFFRRTGDWSTRLTKKEGNVCCGVKTGNDRRRLPFLI
jgi:hypothetical protein